MRVSIMLKRRGIGAVLLAILLLVNHFVPA
jgi:hypothetical protein